MQELGGELMDNDSKDILWILLLPPVFSVPMLALTSIGPALIVAFVASVLTIAWRLGYKNSEES